MNNINLKITTIVLIFASFAFWIFANDYQKDKLLGSISHTNDEKQCLNAYNDSLKDPSTAYIVDSFIWTKEQEESVSHLLTPIYEKYDSVLNVKIMAKNNFGAYSETYIRCPLVDGKVDWLASYMTSMGKY